MLEGNRDMTSGRCTSFLPPSRTCFDVPGGWAHESAMASPTGEPRSLCAEALTRRALRGFVTRWHG